MNEFHIGVKIYDSDWLLKYGFSPQTAASILKDWGVDFVLAQSNYLPMPDSIVDSVISSELAEKYTRKDDLELRKALARVGIEYWATVCTFFYPKAIEQNPELRPIGSDGVPMEMEDWYLGITPSIETYVQSQIEQIQLAVHELHPDGVFLSFTRWPGFWELWMPHHQLKDFPDFSYDPHTFARFTKETNVRVPSLEADNAADWIELNARVHWVNWKCDLITDVVRQIKEACVEVLPGVKVMLNTIPFRSEDYDNAREKVFGQNIETLSDVVDEFEVMTYHQILKRPVRWMAKAGVEVKERSARKTVCTIQAEALYLDGIHAKENRSGFLDDNEFETAVDSIEAAGLDGVVIFIWSDLLKDVYVRRSKKKIEILSDAVQHRQQRLSKLEK